MLTPSVFLVHFKKDLAISALSLFSFLLKADLKFDRYTWINTRRE